MWVQSIFCLSKDLWDQREWRWCDPTSVSDLINHDELMLWLLLCLHFLQDHILPKPRAYYRIDQSAEPDVWLDAVQVWEVKCADLSLSPIYKAAMGLVSLQTALMRFSWFRSVARDEKSQLVALNWVIKNVVKDAEFNETDTCLLAACWSHSAHKSVCHNIKSVRLWL